MFCDGHKGVFRYGPAEPRKPCMVAAVLIIARGSPSLLSLTLIMLLGAMGLNNVRTSSSLTSFAAASSGPTSGQWGGLLAQVPGEQTTSQLQTLEFEPDA